MPGLALIEMEKTSSKVWSILGAKETKQKKFVGTHERPTGLKALFFLAAWETTHT